MHVSIQLTTNCKLNNGGAGPEETRKHNITDQP